MARHLCIALTLCLIVVAESRVLKSRQINLPPGAIIMDVAIRQRSNGTEAASPVATMKLEIDGDDRKLTLYDITGELPPEKVEQVTEDEDFVPEIGSRNGIRLGRCPLGYVKRGSVCFPAD